MSEVSIRPGDLTDPALIALLEDHVTELRETSPPESCHVLDVSELAHPSITVLAAYVGAELVGCGALKMHSAEHAELKSMRTTAAARGRGVGARVLVALEELARSRGVRQLSLETGVEDFFAPARAMYARYGYVECPPFADYVADPLSLFLTKSL